MIKKRSKKRFPEFVALLSSLRQYDASLPEPASLFSLSAKKQLDLCEALEILEALDEFPAVGNIGHLMKLLDALPSEWPANMVSFARQLQEIAHGRAPTRKIFDRSTGDVVLQKSRRPMSYPKA